MPKSHKTVSIKLLIDEATLRAMGRCGRLNGRCSKSSSMRYRPTAQALDAKTIVPKDIPQAFDRARNCSEMRKASIA